MRPATRCSAITDRRDRARDQPGLVFQFGGIFRGGALIERPRTKSPQCRTRLRGPSLSWRWPAAGRRPAGADADDAVGRRADHAGFSAAPTPSGATAACRHHRADPPRHRAARAAASNGCRGSRAASAGAGGAGRVGRERRGWSWNGAPGAKTCVRKSAHIATSRQTPASSTVSRGVDAALARHEPVPQRIRRLADDASPSLSEPTEAAGCDNQTLSSLNNLATSKLWVTGSIPVGRTMRCSHSKAVCFTVGQSLDRRSR
jgi:hypothetical protein